MKVCSSTKEQLCRLLGGNFWVAKGTEMGLLDKDLDPKYETL